VKFGKKNTYHVQFSRKKRRNEEGSLRLRIVYWTKADYKDSNRGLAKSICAQDLMVPGILSGPNGPNLDSQRRWGMS
jgi:hypothetical protein